MDKYYGNVCELDIIFNFQKAYFILDELLLAGEMQESSKKNVLRCISQQDSLEDMEVSPTMLCPRCPFASPMGDALSGAVPQPVFGSWEVPGSSLIDLLLLLPFLSFSPRRNRANALRPRLRKMWSPRSCSDRDSRLSFFFLLVLCFGLCSSSPCCAGVACFSLLFFFTY